MTEAIDTANAEQRAASNPATSAFVAASAGSGKTKLLTDRLLRLMLTGTPPARILCLTYTKAAAAEMAIRLNRRLGEWVVKPPLELDAELTALDVPRNEETRIRARKLFADVLDLAGGMRIATIHAFCQSLLRRFPLEAGLSPHFQLADDTDTAARLREARETTLANPTHHAAILALAAETDEQNFAAQTAKFITSDNNLQQLLGKFGAHGIAAMQRATLAAGEHEHDALLRAAVTWDREQHVAAALRRIGEAGNPSGQKWALKNLEWLAHEAEDRVLHWIHWVDGHFTTAQNPRVITGFYGKGLAAERDALHTEITAEHARIEIIEEQRKTAKLCEINASLTSIIAPILAADTAAKQAAGLLSYAELVSHTGALLKNPGAAWVLYKLDGGIDHLLLDEVQDTAPAQWDIADAIAEEFFAGAGARDMPRSIFAVGDPKQSIFSFQGADLQSFSTYREKFRTHALASNNKWLDGTLSVSFRSTAPVLNLVDAVFATGPARDGVCAPAEILTHGVSRTGQAGAVTLWPLAQAAAPPPPPAWQVPDDYADATSAKSILASSIATHIKTLLDSAAILPSRNRAVQPGDILILVRHRDTLVAAITSECKIRGLPIAGADRMVLDQQQAVSDLLALCDALLLPEHDLAFAQFLASPLGGLTDDSLMQLALNRRQNLAGTLFSRRNEREDWRAANDFFNILRNRADFISPHALLAEALFGLGGRARLLGRLGAQAAEPIDELLAEALGHATREPASLQNFVHTLRHAGATIKRESDASGDVIRIMTVHGAKGLQAPIVILPDTTGLPHHNETLFWLTTPQQPNVKIPIFCPRAGLRPSAITAANQATKAAELAEQNRLLYVALTRAEDELIICGAQPKKALAPECWYSAVTTGFDYLKIPVDGTGIRTLRAPQTAEPDRIRAQTIFFSAPLPTWAGGAPAWAATPPPSETTRPEPLAPSRNTEDDAKRAIAASPLGGALATARQARAEAIATGRAIHALLQHLPDLPPAARGAAAKTYLAQTLPPPRRAATLAAIMSILADPTLAPLFGPSSRAEVPLAGIVSDVEIGGLVDRLAILPEEQKIILADYKTDRAPPSTAAEIPAAYLRQLAAYSAILTQIHPSYVITCLLIFTQTAAILPVSAAQLTGHAPALAQPYAATSAA